MKLFLIAEMDDELRRWSRALQADPHDPSAFSRALRASQRSRSHPEEEWKEPGIQGVEKLRQDPNRWNWAHDRELLPLIMFSISWENLSRNEALAAGLQEIQSQGYQVGEWDVFQEEDQGNEGWMVLTIEVSDELVTHLADEQYIEFHVYPDNGHVIVSADWI